MWCFLDGNARVRGVSKYGVVFHVHVGPRFELWYYYCVNSRRPNRSTRAGQAVNAAGFATVTVDHGFISISTVFRTTHVTNRKYFELTVARNLGRRARSVVPIDWKQKRTKKKNRRDWFITRCVFVATRNARTVSRRRSGAELRFSMWCKY